MPEAPQGRQDASQLVDHGESALHAGNKVVHQHVMYLGEINGSQRRAWERTIAVIDERDGEARQMALFPSDRTPPPSAVDTLQVRLSERRLERPRQWGACWLGDHLWRTLGLDDFFGFRLPVSREATAWEKVLRIIVIYRLLAPGREWRLHRHWFATTALADLLGVDGRAVQDDTRNTPAGSPSALVGARRLSSLSLWPTHAL